MTLSLASLLVLSAVDAQWHTTTGLDGLDVMVVQVPSKRCVVRLAVRAGAGEDPAGKHGLAHAVEHLALGGRPGRDLLISSRSEINALTYTGGTLFTLETSAATCEEELGKLLSVVTDGKLWPSWFSSEMEVIRREAFYRSDRRAILDTSLFGNTPEVVLGTQTTRDTFTPIDVVRFFQNNYVTNNMALVVVGGLEPAAVQRAIDQSIHLAPSLPGEGREREATPVVAKGESRVVALKAGVMALSTALPVDRVQTCRAAAALLKLRLTQKLSPGTASLDVSCLTMQGNLLLSVIIATEPGNQDRLRTIALDEWRSMRVPTKAEKALLDRRAQHEQTSWLSDPSEVADNLAASALWLHGQPLFTVASQWWDVPKVTDADFAFVRAATTPQRSVVVMGSTEGR